MLHTKKIISFQKLLENDKFITNLLVFPLLMAITQLFSNQSVWSYNSTRLVKCTEKNLFNLPLQLWLHEYN